jgi:ComF family protein
MTLASAKPARADDPPRTARSDRSKKRSPTLPELAQVLTRCTLDALLPQTCVVCEQWIASEESPACSTCRGALNVGQTLPYCPRCGRTVSPLSIHCRTERFWNVAGVARVGEYRDESLRSLVLGLKFSAGQRHAEYLGELLADALRQRAWLAEIEAFVPVPMHRLRRWQRSCDHARMLADAVSKRLNVPVRGAAVRRVKYSISHTGRTLSMTARFKNIKDCFAPSRRPKIEGKTVCIVDNVLVSGATVYEVAKVLRKAGAKRIYAAVLARATPPGEPRPSSQALLPAQDRPD